MNFNRTREELIEQLKKIANDKSVYHRPASAMCYSPAVPDNSYVDGTCDRCGAPIKIRSWLAGRKEKYQEIAKQLQEWGFDAQYANLCLECSHAEGIIDDEQYERERRESKRWQDYLEEIKKNPPQMEPDDDELPF